MRKTKISVWALRSQIMFNFIELKQIIKFPDFWFTSISDKHTF